MHRIAALLLLVLSAARAYAGGGPSETVVLVNKASADSQRVAAHYAKARSIAPQQVCEVTCATALDVPMADFVRDVAEPLRDFLRARGLEDRVRFVVLTQGMPIRARTPSGHVSTAAALALLHTPLCGAPQPGVQPPLRSPAYKGALPIPENVACERFLHVTALFSTTADEAVALIDRSVASDGTAPKDALFIYQDANGNAATRNAFYDAARARVEALGPRTEHVGAGPAQAADRKRVMGYMAGGSYSALTPAGVATNEYLPGAICDHLQSFGAVPENFDATPQRHTQFPVAHMIRAGITGVHGAVAEPFTVAFPDPDLFTAYVEGATLAETFSARLPIAYWMNLVLGDPLCAPYAARPKVAVEGAPTGPWKGKVALRVAAPGAKRIAVFVNGVECAAGDGASLAAEVDTSQFADGSAHVLAQAVGEGTWEPRGWTSLDAKFENGRSADAPRPGPSRVGAALLAAEAPAEAQAGVEFKLRVTPVAADGRSIQGWRGRLVVSSADPPVQIAAFDAAPAASVAEVPVRLTRAGTYDFRVRLPDDGVETRVKVVVHAGAPTVATSPLSAVPLAQPTDVDVLVHDAYGNRCDAYDGELTISFPGDPSATVPGAVKCSGGRAVFRDVVVRKAGPLQLVIADATGRVWSQPQEGVTAQPGAVRAWLVSNVARGAAAEALFAADPAAGVDGDGSASGGLLFRRRRSGEDRMQVRAPQDGDACAAAAFVTVAQAGNVPFRLTTPGRSRLFVDGKPVLDGTPGKEASVEVPLAAGAHRVTVVAARQGDIRIDLRVGEAAAVVAEPAPKGPAFCVSGRVRRGQSGGGAAGAKAVVRSAAGAETTAPCAQDGSWFAPGLAPGEYTVRIDGAKPAADPAERKVTIAAAHVTDVDFACADRTPPTVDLSKVAAKHGRRLAAEAAVTDDDAVREVVWLLDGTEIGRSRAAPWRIDANVELNARGKHRLEATATDASGNASAPVAREVEFITDREGPKITLKGHASGSVMKKKTTIAVACADDLPVAEVRYELDGKPFGAPRNAAPWDVEIDPAALAEGAHVLVVVARDQDGNPDRAELRFKTKK